MADDNNGANSNENNGANSNNNDGNTGGNTGGSSGGNSGNGFVLDDATIDRIAEASTRKAAEQHRNGGQNDANGNGNSNDANSNNSNNSNGGMPDWAAALPETISRAVKEAVGTPKQPENNGAGGNGNGAGGNDGGNGGNGGGGNDGGNGSQPGKSKSFGHWWFGVK